MYKIYYFYSFFYLVYFICVKSERDHTSVIDSQTNSSKIAPEDLYIKLFQDKRKLHYEAVQSVSKIEVYERRYKMLNALLEKIFKVLSDAKAILLENTFFPGDPFPSDKKIRDVYSQVLENTAFFGDLLLRQPDMTHMILKKHNDWKLLATWAIGFANETKAFQTSQTKQL